MNNSDHFADLARQQADFAAYKRQQKELEHSGDGFVPPLAGLGLALFLVGAVLDPLLKGIEPYWRIVEPYVATAVQWRDVVVVWVQHAF